MIRDFDLSFDMMDFRTLHLIHSIFGGQGCKTKDWRRAGKAS